MSGERYSSATPGLGDQAIEGEELQELVLAVRDAFCVQAIARVLSQGFAKRRQSPDILGQEAAAGEEGLADTQDAEEEGKDGSADLGGAPQ